MRIEIPEFCIVALVGATSSGKSTFAKKHFLPTEVISSDHMRGLVSDSENDQSASADAFDTLAFIAGKRLKNKKLTVLDATHIQKDSRRRIFELARAYDCHAAAIVFDIPEKLLKERNAERPDRSLPARVIERHARDLKSSIRNLKREGFRFVYVLRPEDVENAEIVKTRLWNDKRDENGPFDIIGDIHGCYDELVSLLRLLEYKKLRGKDGYYHADGRKAVFIGDLCDRGPKNMKVLRLVMSMTESGNAYCTAGNHDAKLLKKLNGKDVQLSNGLNVTLAELEKETDEFRTQVRSFLNGLVSHYIFAGGRLVAAHAGLKEEYQGRASARVRDFCLFGDTTGESDEYGLPVRLDWAAEYRGNATVIYGHTPHPDCYILNNTYNIDTGCVFGGKLSALRFPEREIVSVQAKKCYFEPARKPIDLKSMPGTDDGMLNISDVSGKMIVDTALIPAITVNAENSAAALEVASRFAADPRWLVYLPPTMSPCETSKHEGYLEYPEEAFEYYRDSGIEKVVCEKKHMGSRAVIVIAKNAECAAARFKVTDGKQGVIYTRTGRLFFEDGNTERTIISRLSDVLNNTGFWNDFDTDWVVFDTELMPWSAKARMLLKAQYAPVGVSGRESLGKAVSALSQAIERGNTAYEVDKLASGQNTDLKAVLDEFTQKYEDISKYTEAYREYCWDVNAIDDYRVAPFHILAVEGRVFGDADHIWHMESIKKYCTGTDDIFMATDYIVVETGKDDSISEGVRWWMELTDSGGEGMVVKPYVFTSKQNGKLIQPAVKCRGREYLRIIYGPEYTTEKHLKRLKKRSLGRKRNLALKEFALGMESLKRFTAHEPLYRVHQCVFAVLAFESEPVDPRL